MYSTTLHKSCVDSKLLNCLKRYYLCIYSFVCVARRVGRSVSYSVSRLVCECSRDNSSTNLMPFQTGLLNDIILN